MNADANPPIEPTAQQRDQPTGERRMLLTGSTGYVGGRLLPELLKTDWKVRAMTRTAERLVGQLPEEVEIVEANALEIDTLDAALADVHTAYYFIHSMGSDDDFEDYDRRAAENFAAVATRNNVRRIVYLGGLGNPDHELSKHLRSRQEIGNILRTSSAAVVEYRASIIIGSGSLSFELIRALVERLPVMICPKWVNVLAQPIAIEDVIEYLLRTLDFVESRSEIFEIGGPEQMSYGQIMKIYARKRGLKRWMFSVPFLTPYLSSLWLGLITPVYARIGRKLIESLRNPTLVSNNLALRSFLIRPRGVEAAIDRAIVNEDQRIAVTRWTDAFSSGGVPKTWGGVRFGSRLVDSRKQIVDATPKEAFTPIQRIGGQNGWYYGDWLWKVRGFLDLLVGGVGVRRGRRDANSLRIGDALDFWRVENIVSNRTLLLRAEMKVPGRAWLEFEVTPVGNGQSEIRQTAIFDPVGAFGLAYWYALYPLHQFVFAGMLRNIARAI